MSLMEIMSSFSIPLFYDHKLSNPILSPPVVPAIYTSMFQLVAVLREVKYLELRAIEKVPESAASMYSGNDKLRQFGQNLDLVVRWYNKVRNSVLEVEYPLIEGQLEEIDNQLLQAEKDLNWTSDGKILHLLFTCHPSLPIEPCF